MDDDAARFTALYTEAFREIFRRSPDGVVITDADAAILDVNHAWELITGYSRDEVLGQNPRILKSGKTPPEVYHQMWESLKASGQWQGTLINRRKDGELFYAFFSTVRLGTPDNVVGYVGFMRDITSMLQGEEELKRRVAELRATQQVTVHTLAAVAEHRNPDIHGHLERVRFYSHTLARTLQEMGDWDTPVDEAFLEALGSGSLLHDIGKVGIPEGILFKPAPLNDAERAVVQLHPLIGADILRDADQSLRAELGLSFTFLSMVVDVVLHHHEWWDGSGYPHHLRGTGIPAAARIVALADVYDALTTRRVYRDAMPPEQAAALIRQRSGTHFDPQVVAAFERCLDVFGAVARGGRPHLLVG